MFTKLYWSNELLITTHYIIQQGFITVKIQRVCCTKIMARLTRHESITEETGFMWDQMLVKAGSVYLWENRIISSHFGFPFGLRILAAFWLFYSFVEQTLNSCLGDFSDRQTLLHIRSKINHFNNRLKHTGLNMTNAHTLLDCFKLNGKVETNTLVTRKLQSSVGCSLA